MPNKTRTVRIDLKLLGSVTLSCPRCKKLSDFDPSDLQDSSRGKAITCNCGYALSALVESRNCTRKGVKLYGAYLLTDERGRQESGPVMIEDLSYSGISCRTVASHTLASGDHISVKLVLDDHAKSELVRVLEVTRVEGSLIAGKFLAEEKAFDTTLADYLITC